MSLGVREIAPDSSRADILTAAAQLFMERGYAATSLDEVARSLGATKGRIYHHFPSKADLFAGVFRYGMESNYAAIEPFRQRPGTAVARWRGMAFAHVVQMMVTRPFQRAVWMGVEMHLRGATTPGQRTVFNELIAYREEYGTVFRQLIEEGRQAGDFDFEDLSISSQLMFMTLNSPVFWYRPRVGETRAHTEDLAAKVVKWAFRGLGGREDMA